MEGGTDNGAVNDADACGQVYVLTDEDRVWVRRSVEGFGPLTQEEREWLALMFRGAVGSRSL